MLVSAVDGSDMAVDMEETDNLSRTPGTSASQMQLTGASNTSLLASGTMESLWLERMGSGPSIEGIDAQRRTQDEGSSASGSISSRRGTALHRLVIHRQTPGKITKQAFVGGSSSDSHAGHDPLVNQSNPFPPPRLRHVLQRQSSAGSFGTATPSPSPATSPTRRTLRSSTPPAAIIPRIPTHHHLNQVPPPSPTGGPLPPAAPSPLRRSFMFDGTTRSPYVDAQEPPHSFGTDAMEFGERPDSAGVAGSECAVSTCRSESISDPLMEALARAWGSPLRRRNGPLHVSRLARHTNGTTTSSTSTISRQRQRALSTPINFPPPPPSLPPLHAQAASGNLQGVLAILDTDMTSLHAPDPKGRTALHLAAAGGHVEIVQALISRMPNDESRRGLLDAPDLNGSAPLHLAALSGRLDCVLGLLRGGADPAVGDRFGRTPLDLVKARMRLIAGRSVKTTFGVSFGGGVGDFEGGGDPKAAREKLISELWQMVDILVFYAKPVTTDTPGRSTDITTNPSASLTRSTSSVSLTTTSAQHQDWPATFLLSSHRQRPPRNRGVSEPVGGRSHTPGASLDLEALTAKLMVLSTRQGGKGRMEVEEEEEGGGGGGGDGEGRARGEVDDEALDGILDEIQALLNRLTV
ncbi:hypothetical protein HDU67_004587 [Dinochytrium kinnereticum]|nr:hypothetical protein HDU67_004587 [Dinochytrium kinnereticum]